MKNFQNIAVIREQECIGCAKCIPACPVDAIIGTQQQLHTVIAHECTGCQLCVAPCPVDCIDIIAVALPGIEQRQARAKLARKRVQARQARLHKHSITTMKAKDAEAALAAKKAEIAAIMQRIKARKSVDFPN